MEDAGDDMAMPENRQKNKKKSKKNKKNKKKKGGKKSKKTSAEEEDPEAMLDEMVLAAVQNMAYFGCVHAGMEKACKAKIGKFLKKLDMCPTEVDEELWAEVGLLDEDRLDAVPPRKALVLFDSGVTIKTGQELITENVHRCPS